MKTDNKLYGNSMRFRMLKWLHPIMMTAVMGGAWQIFYISNGVLKMDMSMLLSISVAYIAVLYYLEKVYYALTVGLQRVSEMIYSQGLSLLICAAACFLAGTMYRHTWINPLPILLAFAVQMLLSVLWSLAANRIYFSIYPPPITGIIYDDDADLDRIKSIRYFEERFDVRKLVKSPAEDVEALCREMFGMQVVFVAGCSNNLRSGIAKCAVRHGVRVYFLPRLGEIILAGAEYMSMFSEPVICVQRAQTKTGYMSAKRLMDIAASLIGLIVASPIMIAAAIAIKAHDGGPVFYRQKRLTQNGRVFSILKFRSMNVNAEKDGVARLASENDSRITPVGKFIRATRIDELPQLINILFGDMSLIGPRPERPEIAEEYEKELPEFALRLQVKAGLSGMAQVYGRYNTDPYSKLQMDLMYINKISLATDIKIMFATVKIIFMKEATEGVQEGQRTAAAETPRSDDQPKISA